MKFDLENFFHQLFAKFNILLFLVNNLNFIIYYVYCIYFIYLKEIMRNLFLFLIIFKGHLNLKVCRLRVMVMLDSEI